MIFKKSLICNDAEEEVAVTERFDNRSYTLQATYMSGWFVLLRCFDAVMLIVLELE